MSSLYIGSRPGVDLSLCRGDAEVRHFTAKVLAGPSLVSGGDSLESLRGGVSSFRRLPIFLISTYRPTIETKHKFMYTIWPSILLTLIQSSGLHLDSCSTMGYQELFLSRDQKRARYQCESTQHDNVPFLSCHSFVVPAGPTHRGMT